jgi:hypothetical protein
VSNRGAGWQLVHVLAEELGLEHESLGEDVARVVRVWLKAAGANDHSSPTLDGKPRRKKVDARRPSLGARARSQTSALLVPNAAKESRQSPFARAYLLARPKGAGGLAKDKRVGPKKPISSYMFFNSDAVARSKVQQASPTRKDLGRLMGEAWRALSEEEKAPYKEKAKADRARYGTESAALESTEGSTMPDTSAQEDAPQHAIDDDRCYQAMNLGFGTSRGMVVWNGRSKQARRTRSDKRSSKGIDSFVLAARHDQRERSIAAEMAAMSDQDKIQHISAISGVEYVMAERFLAQHAGVLDNAMGDALEMQTRTMDWAQGIFDDGDDDDDESIHDPVTEVDLLGEVASGGGVTDGLVGRERGRGPPLSPCNLLP